jgi:hypothetical protein
MEKTQDNRKYDVAFSFRVADLPLAQRLADAIDLPAFFGPLMT